MAEHSQTDADVDGGATRPTSARKEDGEYERGPPRACVFVANFRPENEPELRELFEQHGAVLRLKVLRDVQSPRTYAFVQYRLPAEADRAIQHVNGVSLGGRTLRVELAKVQRTLFLAKLPQSMDEDQLRAVVQEFGPLEKLTIITNHLTQKSRCCGFVKFAYREDALVAFDALRNSQRRWIVEWSISHESDPAPVAEKSDTVFVGNLPASATKEAVEARFAHYGTIEHVTFVDRATPRPASSSDADAQSSDVDAQAAATSSDAATTPATTQQQAADSTTTTTDTTATTVGDASAAAGPSTTDTEHGGGGGGGGNDDDDDDDQQAGRNAPAPGKSFAFVRYAEAAAATSALEQNGQTWDDCQLRCEPAEAKSRRNAKNGGQRERGAGYGGHHYHHHHHHHGGAGGASYAIGHPPTLLHRQIYPRGGADHRRMPHRVAPVAGGVAPSGSVHGDYDPAVHMGYRGDHHLYYPPIPELGGSAFDPRTGYHAGVEHMAAAPRRAAGGGPAGAAPPHPAAAGGFRPDGRHQHHRAAGPMPPYVHAGYPSAGSNGRHGQSAAAHASRRGGAGPAVAAGFAGYPPHQSGAGAQQLYPPAAAGAAPGAGSAKRRDFALEAGPDPVSRQSPSTFAHSHFQPMGAADYDASAQWGTPYSHRPSVRQQRSYGHAPTADSEHTRSEDSASRW